MIDSDKLKGTARVAGFLGGFKVLDLSRHFPGPLATLYMADLGAKVVKIEAPGGDEIRQFGPRTASGSSAYFDAMHAGKRILRLNLTDESEVSLFLSLAKEADVLVESFRPGVMSRLGLGYERLSVLNPRLIYCGLSGYGVGGPLEQCAGHDANYLALAGVLDRNGVNGPVNYDPPLADLTASLTALVAILGATIDRGKSGVGCHLDVALCDAIMPGQTLELAELAATGRSPQPDQGLFTGNTACYSPYRTADGRYFMLGAAEPKFWSAFCRAAGREDWVSRQLEGRPQTALKRQVAEFFGSMSFDECENRFAGVDCCLTPVLDLAGAVDAEHARHRKVVRRTVQGGIEALFPVLVNGTVRPERSAIRYFDSKKLLAANNAGSIWGD